MKEITFAVEGMKCNGCVGKIEEALKAQGASEVTAALAEKKISVKIEGEKSAIELKKAIEKSGGFKVIAVEINK